jgi:hypothetical protein
MGEDDKKAGVLAQIVVAVVIALIAGGSSPWWWSKVFSGGDKKERDSASKESPIAPVPVIPTAVRAGPTSDFLGGTRRVYSADFIQWPTNSTGEGSALPEGGEYVIHPSGNAWIGTGHPIDIQPLDGDFVFDMHFRVDERTTSVGLQMELTGPGQDADYVEIFFELWDQNNVTYSLDKGWIKDGHYLTRDKLIAERQQLPTNLKAHDWSKGTKITLKREGGKAQFFVNDGYVADFPVTLFPVAKIYIAAAWPSKIAITSIEGRKP